LLECGVAILILSILRSCAREYADTPHAFGLLRTRRERLRCAAEKRDELAPSHCVSQDLGQSIVLGQTRIPDVGLVKVR